MSKALKWYEIKAAAPVAAQAAAQAAGRTAEIYIYGNIGDRWDENGVVAADLVRELAALEVDTITLRINSYGGSVPDGLAIYNALKRHKAAVDVQVDGVAISCAGYIAMAGDTVTMADNAMLMIHAPWGLAMGNSAELREQADMLDKYAAAMATSYASKSGKSVEQCMALLTDGKDHWYTAAEAQADGFCDTVGPAVEVAASLAKSYDLSRFPRSGGPAAGAAPTHPTAAAVTTRKEASMPEAAGGTPAVVTPFARSTEMNQDILAKFKPFAARAGVTELQTQILADTAVTVEQAQARLLQHLGADAAPANPQGAHPRVEVVADEADKFRAAATQAILVRAGVEKAPADIRANPVRGAKMVDIARMCLERAGIKTQGMSQMEVVASAFTQSTSDFPILLENTMHKSLQAGYATAALTWSRFCKTGSVSDFRPHNRYRTSSIGTLDTVNELGEFKNKSIPDGEKSSVTAGTKGNVINLSRQAMINDDLGAFIGLSTTMGRSAARTIETMVYALLAENSGLGPTMTDGYTLFHANHSNITTAAAIAMAAIDLDRVAMGSQLDVGGNDYLDLRPAVLLVPISLGGTARSINDAQYDPDTANKLQKPNTVRGLFRDVVDTPRLTGTRRYLFADPQEAPVIEVSFLDGAQEPYLEVQDGFDVDGARMKVRLDVGVDEIDYRGAVTNAGA